MLFTCLFCGNIFTAEDGDYYLDEIAKEPVDGKEWLVYTYNCDCPECGNAITEKIWCGGK